MWKQCIVDPTLDRRTMLRGIAGVAASSVLSVVTGCESSDAEDDSNEVPAEDRSEGAVTGFPEPNFVNTNLGGHLKTGHL